MSAGPWLAGRGEAKLSGASSVVPGPFAAQGGVVVAGGGGRRHVGVCKKRGAPGPFPSGCGRPAGARIVARSPQDAAAAAGGVGARPEGPRKYRAGPRGGGWADARRESRGRVSSRA